MPIEHSYNASNGQLISPARWNAEHTVSGEPTMIVMNLLSEPNGYDVAVSTSYLPPDAGNPMVFYIPGGNILDVNRTSTSVRWSATGGGENIDLRVFDVSTETQIIGQAYANLGGGTYTTTLDSNLDIGSAFPSGNGEYCIKVKGDVGSATVSLYSVVLYLWVA